MVPLTELMINLSKDCCSEMKYGTEEQPGEGKNDSGCEEGSC